MAPHSALDYPISLPFPLLPPWLIEVPARSHVWVGRVHPRTPPAPAPAPAPFTQPLNKGPFDKSV